MDSPEKWGFDEKRNEMWVEVTFFDSFSNVGEVLMTMMQDSHIFEKSFKYFLKYDMLEV